MRVILLLGIGAMALPTIVSAKWFIRSGASLSDAMDFLSEFGYYNYFIESMGYVVNRFQHLGHVAMLAEDSQHLSAAYRAGEFIPFWMDGAPQWLYLRSVGEEIYQLQRYIPSYYFDVNNLAYTVNPGIAGWFFVLRSETVVLVLYVLIITALPLRLLSRFAGYRYFLFLSCFILVYLFHGWIGAYVNMVVYLLTFLFIKRAFVVARSTGRASLSSRRVVGA